MKRNLAKTAHPSLLHIQIRNRLTKAIESGEFRPGAQLPTEKQIMAEFDVSRGTVIRAIRELESQGMLRRKRGSGTFVSSTSPRDTRTISNLHIARFVPMVLDHDAGSQFQHQINHALSGMCSQHHAMMSLHYVAPGKEPFASRLRATCEQILTLKPRAVLYTTAELPADQMSLNEEVVGRLSDAGIPVVLIDRDICIYPDRSKYTWIGFDNRRSGAQLTLHLLSRRYHRLAFVGIAQASTAVSDRISGYLDALRAAGIPRDESKIFLIDGMPDEALCEALLRGEPDAIICKDSNFAAIVGRLLTRRGIRLGTEMGLAGFDENSKAELLPVPLTIIRQPVMPLVSAAIRIAIGNDGAATSGEHVQIKSELVIRQSTCGIGHPASSSSTSN